ncbi:LON peptidase substrate-binding domain-containing protein [Burkholderia plantarii]|uniref:ATP-dependent protease La (LON) domain protein n=1 Tax=Burkholderia plantarii TaxID=41899 RepID=A0A0B6S382_BURPL|nr:LON peptidase substrate-binding domain-containing protein [Burkholderia plantarii]AJK47770.1 ATP-dependent protease La (LON) domain protein [Burkholderia plantarii]ALK31958.1 ATP-dependent protease La [Burkholderia plantarii]WLE60677.1 LON peptidase substrate-binding domain-containing protein [Burkholderia plantarii]GLZ21098.1 ATP-dependent protease [Burkholderia plantarii]
MSSLSTTLVDLPLFPLHTVLFPGGLLPLKVFEQRYVDMARSCLRDRAPFGVCLLKSGPEVAQDDAVSVPEPVGCMAEIIECDTGEFGMLLLRTVGTRRFRLLSHRVEANGLLVGIAEALPEDEPLDGELSIAQFGACSEVLERIIVALRNVKSGELPFLEPFHFEDPTWVSNRLAEVLPLDLRARQKMMELPGVGARIDAVHQVLKRHDWL